MYRKKENKQSTPPAQCTKCQSTPNVVPDLEKAKNCDVCQGKGYVQLQMSETKFLDMQQKYSGKAMQTQATCPLDPQQTKPATHSNTEGLKTQKRNFPHATETSFQIIRGLLSDQTWYHYARMHEKYGDSYTASFPKKTLVTQDPLLAYHILHTNFSNFSKPATENPFFKEILEITNNQNNLFFAKDMDFWKKSRKAAKDFFLKGKLEDYFPKIRQITLETAATFDLASEHNSPVNVREILATMALKNMLYNLFDECDVDPHEFHQHMNTALFQIGERAVSLTKLRWMLPTKDRRAWKDSYAYVKGAAVKIIEDRNKSPKSYDDLLNSLMKTYGELFKGKSFQDSLVGDMIVYLIAGHDTTAATLNAAFKYLSLYPDITEKLCEEIKSVVGDGPLEFEHIDQLVYTKMVFNESLRLQSPVSLTPRIALNDDEFEGYTIPKGTNIFINLSGINRNPKYWDNPEAFNPERFREKRWGQEKPYAFAPFGGGPRICIGMNFAALEAITALAILVPKYKATLLPGRLLKQDLDLTAWPMGAEEMMIHKRQTKP